MSDTGARQFDKLVAPYLPMLFRVAWRLLRNTADAEDLVQETCIVASQNAPALAAANHPGEWLLRALGNRFINGARRRKRPQVLPMEGDAIAETAGERPGPGDLHQWAQSEQLLQQAFLALEETQRLLLVFLAEGYDLAEMAALTGINEEALSARIYRARRRLAHELARRQRMALPSQARSKP